MSVVFQVKEIKKEFGLSQKDLAALFETGINRIKSLESGRVKRFNEEEINVLVNKLNLSRIWIITGEGEKILSKSVESIPHDTDHMEWKSFLPNLPKHNNLLKLKSYSGAEPKLAIFTPFIFNKIPQNFKTQFEKNKRQNRFKYYDGDIFVVMGNILTQTHRDLIDCILLCGTRKPNNHFVFSFDDIKELWPSIQPEFLKNLLDELQTTVVERKIIGESVSIVSSLKSNPDIADIAINDRFYPFLEPKIEENKLVLLLQTKSGLIKAIARYFILVENDIVGVSNIDVDTVFTAIGIAKNDKTEYLKILAEDASELSKFGIEFDQQTETFIKND